MGLFRKKDKSSKDIEAVKVSIPTTPVVTKVNNGVGSGMRNLGTPRGETNISGIRRHGDE